jgi:hypothetical protein
MVGASVDEQSHRTKRFKPMPEHKPNAKHTRIQTVSKGGPIKFDSHITSFPFSSSIDRNVTNGE